MKSANAALTELATATNEEKSLTELDEQALEREFAEAIALADAEKANLNSINSLKILREGWANDPLPRVHSEPVISSISSLPHDGRNPVETLLSRLDKVRDCGGDRWMAKCPSHEDRSPSLSIRVASDGTILIKDFGGCGTADVLAAIGMELRDLFPNGPVTPHGRPKKPNHWHASREALKALHFEVLFVLVCAENMHKGIVPNDGDRERLAVAVFKLREAAEYCA